MSEHRPASVRPPSPRWTHIALPCDDIDATIAWYERFTPLRLLDRREDADGYGAWLGHPDMADKPFILVLVSFFRDQGTKQPIMAPFAHLGIELTSREDVDEIGRAGEAEGCLMWAAAADAAADRLHLRAHRPRRQRRRVQLRPGRLRQGPGGLGRRGA